MRFGVLGTGFWADEVHAASLAAHPDAELVGVWGRDPEKARKVAEHHEVRPYADLDALLADVEAVSFSLPPQVQADLAVRAAEAGRHLLLEKPIALDVAAADRLVAAAQQARVASVVFFTLRFQTGTQTWLEQVARTRPAGGSAAWLGSIAGSPFAASPWRQQHGALWDIGPHCLSVLLPALGPVTAVQAGGGMGDTVHLVLTHASGAASTVTVSHTVAPMAAGTEISVHGDAGRVTLLPEDGTAVACHGVAVTELVAAALTGGAHPCDVGFGREVVGVLAAAERALASGCREGVGG